MSVSRDVVLAPMPGLEPLGSCRPVLAYPIAGRPLYLHLLERMAAAADGALRIQIGDPWFHDQDQIMQQLRRFGVLVPVSTGQLATTAFPMANGSQQPLEYVWHLLDIAADILAQQQPAIAQDAEIEDGVEIVGNVRIEAGAKVLAGSRIKGNVYIGPQSFIGNGALVRGSVHIGDKVMLGFASEIKSSLLFERAIVGPSSAVPDSVLEEGVFLGGMVRISNTQLGFRNVCVMPEGEKVDSGRQFLGATIAAEAKLAGGVRVSPGRGIGRASEVGPGVMVTRTVSPGTRLRLVQELVCEQPAPGDDATSAAR